MQPCANLLTPWASPVPRDEREIVSFFVPGKPLAFRRAGTNGKRRYTPASQASYMRAVGLIASRAFAGIGPLPGPLRMTVAACWAFPKSYTAADRLRRFMTSVPDADNVGKLIADSLNEIAYADDAQICELHVSKRFGAIAGVTVSIEQLEPAQ
jgi:Holliday junction resolvase RusA-like endonuclease